MKKGEKIETLILGEEVIHHIQSFMSRKEAARSAILSKSWYDAWLTRPTIDFDYRDFLYRNPPFEEFAKKTMQRYRDLNLKIESFKLHSYLKERKRKERRDLSHELIAYAIKIGATHLRLDMDRELPREVFRSETLLELFLNHFYVYGNYVISCSSLKSLTLKNVDFYGDVVFMDITSCCVSMEELSLSALDGLKLRQNIELHKLRRLYLCAVNVGTLFFTNFESRFPCLKDLTIHYCNGCENIHIASTSLQTISFEPKNGSDTGKFDIPNIRKFTYSAFDLPSHLSINGASSWEWELNISITCYELHEASWFKNLKKLLKKFRLSRISLFIDLCVCSWSTGSEHAVDVEVVRKPLVVENLTIATPPTFCCALLLRSFGAFRPKFITLCDSRRMLHKVKAVDIFSKRLNQALIVSKWQDKFGQFGLKRLNVEICEEFDTEWRPLQSEKAQTASEAKVEIRFTRRTNIPSLMKFLNESSNIMFVEIPPPELEHHV